LQYHLIYLFLSLFYLLQERREKKMKHRSTATRLCGHFLRLPSGGTLHPSLQPTSRHKGIASAKGNESGKNLILELMGCSRRAIFNPCLFMLIHHPRHQQQLVLPRRPGPRRTIGFLSTSTYSDRSFAKTNIFSN
jgi:hypothetical protein